MKKVILLYDVSNDLIECPDRIADNFDEALEGIYDWIENDPDGAKYKVLIKGLGEVGHIISTESILEYLNSKCIKPDEEKAKLYKKNVSRDVYADNWAEF